MPKCSYWYERCKLHEIARAAVSWLAMVTFDEQLRALVEMAKGERISQALDERFGADSGDTEACLAVYNNVRAWHAL